MELGIVGKPNTGKSTLFRAITRKEVESANYPFTTVEPNEGVAFATTECVCTELEADCDPNGSKCVDGRRFVPVNVLDVAGLVPDAAEGKGMGNEFLDSIREADALIHVLDAAGTTNAEGEPADDYDPVQDVTFVEDEFDAWIAQLLQEGIETHRKKLESGELKLDEFLADRFSGLGITLQDVRTVLDAADVEDTPLEWGDEDCERIASRLRSVSKPTIFAANKIDLDGAEANLEDLRTTFEDDVFVPTSAQAELTLRKAAEADKIRYTPGDDGFEITDDISAEQEEGLERIRQDVLDRFGSTGVQELVDKAVFDLLDMIVVYPVEDTGKYTDQKGNVLPDAVLLERGSTPVDLAYTIHSDIGDDYVKAVDARTGQTLGKDHELEHGAVVKIVT